MARQLEQRYVLSAGETEMVTVDFSEALEYIEGICRTGSTSTSVILGLEASATNDAYNNLLLWITGGTGAGQWATISDYTGSTRAATVAAMATTLDTTSTYRVTEALTGTPTIVEVTSTDLTLGSKAVTTEPREVLGSVIPPGLGLSFTVAGQTAGKAYTIRITTTTTGSPARTKVFDFCFEVAS